FNIKELIEVGENRKFEKIINENLNMNLSEDRDPNATAAIFYTSGTTGKPKGVMLTNRNCEATARINSISMKTTPQDRVLIMVPMYHCGGCHTVSLSTLYAGATLIIQKKFSTERTIKI